MVTDDGSHASKRVVLVERATGFVLRVREPSLEVVVSEFDRATVDDIRPRRRNKRPLRVVEEEMHVRQRTPASEAARFQTPNVIVIHENRSCGSGVDRP